MWHGRGLENKNLMWRGRDWPFEGSEGSFWDHADINFVLLLLQKITAIGQWGFGGYRQVRGCLMSLHCWGIILYIPTDTVREAFTGAGLPSTDPRPLQSHLTVSKISGGYPCHTRALKYRIPPHTYSGLVEEVFGEQQVEGLELYTVHD